MNKFKSSNSDEWQILLVAALVIAFILIGHKKFIKDSYKKAKEVITHEVRG
jgi:hypothetical protein